MWFAMLGKHIKRWTCSMLFGLMWEFSNSLWDEGERNKYFEIHEGSLQLTQCYLPIYKWNVFSCKPTFNLKHWPCYFCKPSASETNIPSLTVMASLLGSNHTCEQLFLRTNHPNSDSQLQISGGHHENSPRVTGTPIKTDVDAWVLK